MQLYEHTAHELLAKLTAKQTDAATLLAAVVARADELEPKTNNFITRVEQSEKEQGPLGGIPYALADNICTRDIKTTCASKMLESFVPPYSATVHERLLAAGGVLVGKTNLDEFGVGDTTETSHFGPSRKADDAGATPGSGAAGAVASGEAVFAIATDTGGELRRAAAYSGVVGLLPTYGRVSRFGVAGFASSVEHVGVLAKDVQDAALALSVICGRDEKDATTVDMPCDFMPVQPQSGLKFGALFEAELPGEEYAKLKSAIAGSAIEPCTIDELEHAAAAHYIIAAAEGASNMSRYGGIEYGYQTKSFANINELYVNSRSEAFGYDLKGRILLGTHFVTSGNIEVYFKKAQQVRTLVKKALLKAFERFDVLVAPAALTAEAPKIGEPGADVFSAARLSAFVNLAGLCALTLPVGRGGVQLVAPPYAEKKLLGAAYALEQSMQEG